MIVSFCYIIIVICVIDKSTITTFFGYIIGEDTTSVNNLQLISADFYKCDKKKSFLSSDSPVLCLPCLAMKNTPEKPCLCHRYAESLR